VLVAAAAGNQGSLGSTAITPHPWVLPVGACDRRGRPSAYSNFGRSIGLRGLSAPGDGISSLTPVGATADPTGTSSAAPLVTGAIALMGSEFPAASAMQVRLASARAHPSRRLVPPLLNAIAGWRALAAIMGSPE
jgi:subtilisin family serine protease